MEQRGMLSRIENIATSILLRSALVLLLVLIFVPHVATWFWGSTEGDNKKEKPSEDRNTAMAKMTKKVASLEEKILNMDENFKKHNEDRNTAMAKMKERVTSLEEKLLNMDENLEFFNSSVQTDKQQLSELKTKVEKLSSDDNKHPKETISKIETRMKELGEADVRLEKKIEDNINQMKKIEDTTYWVDILLVFILLIILIYITNMAQRNRGGGLEHHKNTQLKKRPAVVCFNPSSSDDHRKLADLFLNNYTFIIIYDYQDISKIHSKVVFLFVDFNERNIILENYTETQQIKTETVQAIRKMGGTPVVIYRLHSDSRGLGGRKLYSDKLTSVENHPILRELLEKDCVLSIDKKFTEYQQTHLKLLLENNL